METVLPLKPTASDIHEASVRIAPYINRTPVLQCSTLNKLLGGTLFFKCENFQKVGAFKARGATNAVLSLDQSKLNLGVATHSSGNHAQALARAARLAGTKAYIVMPSDSNPVKVNAVKEYGGNITFCEPTLVARETTLNEILNITGAQEIHPYNDARIIAGQATAALELITEIDNLDIVMAPVGGGGLLSGTSLAVHYFHQGTKVIAAEPEMANDAYRSFIERKFIPSLKPETIADGLRTSLGTLTFPIICDHVSNIVTVSEASIVKAMRLIWERMKIIIEPSSAVPVAALLEKRIDTSNQRIGIILSGGNADLDQLPWIHHA